MLRIGLKAKLFLVTLSLAAIPLVGIGYVREMEVLLAGQQEANLLAAARAIAAALNERPALLRLKPQDPVLRREKEEAITAMLGGPGSATAGAATTGEPVTPAGVTASAPSSGAAVNQTAGQTSNQTATQSGGQSANPTSNQTAAQVIATEASAAPRAVSDEVENIVASLNRKGTRVWMIDKRFQLLALTGTLKSGMGTRPDAVGTSGSTGTDARKPLEDNASGPATWWEKAEDLLLRPLYQRLLTRPTEDFDDALPEDAIVSGSEVARALAGSGATRWRATPDSRARILSAAHPVWAANEVVAAVVVEETGNAIASFTSRALEKLITATLAVFVLVAGVVLLFATRLAGRVRRLRDEAESAIDAQGRVRTLAAASNAGDEVGDLSRSFSQLLERLAQYHDYLENLGARITHEFRTPVTIVRSSLDNLAMQPLPAEAHGYMQRANDGLKRLDNLISRMGEARRLEQALRDSERSIYDAGAVIKSCVEGYRMASAQQVFETHIDDAAMMVNGSPDLLAQAFDKLIANAMSFAAAASPVLISLRCVESRAVLDVGNTGLLLPPGPVERLFDSMVSMRADDASSAEPHLGLGLYVVRLAAQFHHGSATASNRVDRSGVSFTLTLPLAV